MSVNIEQIKKLIRLANNNPNENEANLAARRVCKLLDNYEFTTPVFNPMDIMKGKVTRRQEDFIRQETMRRAQASLFKCDKCGHLMATHWTSCLKCGAIL